MNGEVLSLMGTGILAVTSIGGWVYALRKNGRAEGVFQEKVAQISDRFNKLPCVENLTYFTDMGAMRQKLETLGEDIKEIKLALRSKGNRTEVQDG